MFFSSWEGCYQSSHSYQGAHPEHLAGEDVVRVFHPWCSCCWAGGSWAGAASQCWTWKWPSQQQHSLPSSLLSSVQQEKQAWSFMVVPCVSHPAPFHSRKSLALGPLLGGEQFSCFCHNKTCHHSGGHPVQHPAHNRISAGTFRSGCSRLWRLGTCSGAMPDHRRMRIEFLA